MKKLALITLALCLAVSCSKPGGSGEVVLYTSLNEPTARAVLDVFERESGLRVRLTADTERDKTVGLVRTLLEEQTHPRADVFWNSEAANTVRLQRAGVLEKLDPPPAGWEAIPTQFRDPDGVWFGFAARARVLIVNTDLVPASDRPRSIWDLVDPRWKGQAGIVRPVTGTTLTHLTALHETLPPAEYERFLAGIRANECHLPPGNGRLAKLVGEGQIHFGLTDSSDYRLVKAEGLPVDAIYPDQDGLGTLVIPNTVARVRGGPNPEGARKLIEFLLSERAEEILAFHQRGHIPLKPGVKRPPEVAVPGEFRTMKVDFLRIGAEVEARMRELDARFP
ncbi:MAG: extracellular solute-binding protein [Planctomycetes bacterium]|nr:extracellular solute-binding protein [Planctomycetota bacterium]